MKKVQKKRKPGQHLYELIQRAAFDDGDTRLVIEDRINTLVPWTSERMLWIAGTDAYYSIVPLCPAWHELLCFTYCKEIMKTRDPSCYRQVLVLGCGGGAVPRWLLEEYPSLLVDVVDRSPRILEICREYFIHEWAACDRLRMICTDARDYEPPRDPYQFIFCDLFDGRSLAPVVYTRAFAHKLRRMCAGDGILVINCGWHDLEEILSLYGKEFAYLQKVWREPGQTQVIMASGSPLPDTLASPG